LASKRRRIAFRIDGNEQHLDALCVLTQFLHDQRKFAHGSRTNVRAIGVAEKNHHHLALEILERARLAIVIGQFENRARIQRR